MFVDAYQNAVCQKFRGNSSWTFGSVKVNNKKGHMQKKEKKKILL